jgi:putative SOS response-associated peptidase YedK
MCNLYRLPADRSDVAGHFDAINRAGNAPGGELYPGGMGMVVRAGAEGRELVGMTWGFPLAQIGKRGQPIKPKPVNNARADKLLTAFWKGTMIRPAQRCLIPLEAFAEAEGEPGRKTPLGYPCTTARCSPAPVCGDRRWNGAWSIRW